MFRHRPKSLRFTRLVVLLFAFLFAVAACSGSPDVEEDASAASGNSSEDAEAVADEGGDDDAGGETENSESAETESDAMGEDDADASGDVGDEAMGEDDNATTDTTEGTSAGAAEVQLDDAELAAALAAGTSDRFSLPFMYLTVDQDCDGCAPTMSLYYVPGPVKASILTLEGAYIDGVLQSDFSQVDPVLQAGDPRRVAEQLSGTDATFGVDPVSGAITSWSLDGNSVNLRCLQVDTRPVDMRTELCENSIIG